MLALWIFFESKPRFSFSTSSVELIVFVFFCLYLLRFVGRISHCYRWMTIAYFGTVEVGWKADHYCFLPFRTTGATSMFRVCFYTFITFWTFLSQSFYSASIFPYSGQPTSTQSFANPHACFLSSWVISQTQILDFFSMVPSCWTHYLGPPQSQFRSFFWYLSTFI